MIEFDAVLQQAGKTATGIEVPDDVVTGLGGGKRPPVKVTINGFTYQTTIAPMGGSFWIPVSAERRDGAGIAARDEVRVAVELDSGPRAVDVPDDLAAGLAAEPGVRATFDALAFTHRKEFVRWVTDAKRPETRANRVAKTVAQVQAGRSGR